MASGGSVPFFFPAVKEMQTALLEEAVERRESATAPAIPGLVRSARMATSSLRWRRYGVETWVTRNEADWIFHSEPTPHPRTTSETTRQLSHTVRLWAVT